MEQCNEKNIMLIPNEPPSAHFSPQCNGPMDGWTDKACPQLKRKRRKMIAKKYETI